MTRLAALRGVTVGHRRGGGVFTMPIDAATQTFGILAKRRVGKTYTASVMAEEFAACGVPFVALDPTGAWWGLRSSADGSKAGLSVVILGGSHGDVPLERGGGKLVADLVVDHPGFYVLDLSGFESNAAQDHFAADFAERLYRRKAAVPTPLHLFIDEADSFAPQRPGPGQLRMLGAVEAIVRRGGIRGIGTTLISQRAAVVNKNVLTQLDCLIALQVTGPQDQKAIRDWVSQAGSAEQVKAMMDNLAGLGRGEAWVWSPGWLDVFELVQIRERRTFNSSATPEVGTKAVTPAQMAKVDLEAVRVAMAATLERAKADDPGELKKVIAALRKEVAAKPTSERVEVTVEVPMLGPEHVVMLQNALAAAREFNATMERIEALIGEPGPKDAIRAFARSVPVAPPTRVVAAAPPESGPLKAGARKMLDVVARHHPLVLTRSQLGTLTGMSHTGGTFSTYLSAMRRAGYIDLLGKEVRVTDEGLAAAGVAPGNPMGAEDVRETWRGSLKAGARSMFDTLVARRESASDDGWVTRQWLAEQVGIEVTGGTFSTYLSTLRRNGLIEVAGSGLRATDTALGVFA